MAKDPNRTISIHGDKYTYDKGKDKWMSGKQVATPSTAAMLDMILKQMEPEGDQEVESFVGTANLISGPTEQEETPEEIQAREDAHERKEEAQDDMEAAPPPPVEEVVEAVKPPITTENLVVNQERPIVEPAPELVRAEPLIPVKPPKSSDLVYGEPIKIGKDVIKPGDPTYDKIMGPPPAQAEAVKPAPTQGVTLPKPKMPAEEQTVGQTPVAERVATRREKVKQDFDSKFTKELSKNVPAINLATDKTAGKSPSGMEAITDASNNIAEMFGDFKNWPLINKLKKKEEPLAQRESLDKLTDLSPEEIKRLEARGVAPASEKDFSYRKEGKPLSKEDITKELNQGADEHNTRLDEEANKPEPFYQRKAKQLKEQFGQSFKGHLREKLPMLRLFTDKLDEDTTADTTKTSEATGVSGNGAVDSLKSIDKNIQQIVGILKDNKKEEKEKDKKEEQEDQQDEAQAETVKEESKEAGALKSLDQKSDTNNQSDAEPAEESAAYGLGKKTRNGINKVKEGFDKIREKFSAKPALAAETVAEGASAEGATAAAAGGGVMKSLGGLKKLAKLIPGPWGKLASVLPFANGGVVEDAHAVKMFADGGVVDQPTMFSHKGGTGVMGEAGAEAIMPLKRGPDGKLGVKTADMQKPAITDQTKVLSDVQDMRKAKQDEKSKPQQPAAGATIINTTNNNNQSGGGGGGGYSPTAGARNSLDLYYFA